MEYTLPLALEDFIPVILSSAGLFIISQMVRRIHAQLGQMAQLGWLLVSLGGLLKAVWKLTMAVTHAQTNLAWLDKGMFIWMAAGFTLLAFALWYTAEIMMNQGQTKAQKRPWLGPAVIMGLTVIAIVATGFPDLTVNTWRFILLGITTISNVVTAVLLIQKSRRLGRNLAAFLFLTNIIIIFVLSGLARIPSQTIALQWTEQLLNTLSQGAFVFAAWQLAQKVNAHVMMKPA
jgi:hypothetical protein